MKSCLIELEVGDQLIEGILKFLGIKLAKRMLYFVDELLGG